MIETSGDYAIQYTIGGANANEFSLFLSGIEVEGTTYGADEGKQTTVGTAIVRIDAPATLTLRNNLSFQPPVLQKVSSGVLPAITASLSLTRLNIQTTATVTNAAELLAALEDETISTIDLAPGIYDLSALPPVVRSTAVRLQSAAPGAAVTFNNMQDLHFITVGSFITLATNRIYNVNQQLFYTDLPTAVSSAADGDIVLVYPGAYILAGALTIANSITLRGFSADLTTITFPDSLINTVSLIIQADNVIVEGLHFIGPTSPSEQANALLSIPTKTPIGTDQPIELYDNITIASCIFQGGRRGGFATGSNLSIVGNRFLFTGVSDCLDFIMLAGKTTVTGNTFSGGASRRAILIQGSSNTTFTGEIIIQDNTATSFTGLAEIDIGSNIIIFFGVPTPVGFQGATILIKGNTINHETRSGSSVIFVVTGPNDFSEVHSIRVEDNTFINPNIQRLAVLLDYTFGGTSVPYYQQVKVFNNLFDIAVNPAPPPLWGNPGSGDVVDPNYPVGIRNNASVSLDSYELVLNTVFNMPQ